MYVYSYIYIYVYTYIYMHIRMYTNSPQQHVKLMIAAAIIFEVLQDAVIVRIRVILIPEFCLLPVVVARVFKGRRLTEHQRPIFKLVVEFRRRQRHIQALIRCEAQNLRRFQLVLEFAIFGCILNQRQRGQLVY